MQPLTVEKVPGVTAAKNGPQRRDPMSGLKPFDFVKNRNWPHGRLVVPQALYDYGLNRSQAHALVSGVGLLRELVIDYERYLQGAHTTQETVARELVISTGRLSAMRTGRSWPVARVYTTLRAHVPSRQAMDQGRFEPGARTE